MCGRFNIVDSPLIHALLASVGLPTANLPTRYNLAPTDTVPLIHQLEGKRCLSQMHWWLTPHWATTAQSKYAMFNACWENLESSPAWRSPFRYRRGIIPASSFIEWQLRGPGKQPLLVQSAKQALAFAALWDLWEKDDHHWLSCAIVTVTVPASPEFAPVHARMPLILREDMFESWLAQDGVAPKEFKRLQAQIPLQIDAVQSDINNSRNKSEPRLIGASD